MAHNLKNTPLENILLSWPKRVFRFVMTAYGKTWTNFLANSIVLSKAPVLSRWVTDLVDGIVEMKAVNPKEWREILSKYEKLCAQEYGIVYNRETWFHMEY